MKREIKFRGKRFDNGAWETGGIDIPFGSDMPHKAAIIDKRTQYHTPVKPDTVGQFTGLLDKNGNEIYEGDIITSDEIHTRAIKWNSYECKFNAVEWGIDKAIILGNIHDNQELLKSDEHE